MKSAIASLLIIFLVGCGLCDEQLVRHPDVDTSIAQATADYEMLGFPGALQASDLWYPLLQEQTSHTPLPTTSQTRGTGINVKH